MRWFLSRTAALVQPPSHGSSSDEGGKLCIILVSRSLHCGQYVPPALFLISQKYYFRTELFSSTTTDSPGFITLFATTTRYTIAILALRSLYVSRFVSFLSFFSFSFSFLSVLIRVIPIRKQTDDRRSIGYLSRRNVNVRRFRERSFPVDFKVHEGNAETNVPSNFRFGRRRRRFLAHQPLEIPLETFLTRRWLIFQAESRVVSCSSRAAIKFPSHGAFPSNFRTRTRG